MRASRFMAVIATAIILGLGFPSPAPATTLIREGVAELTQANEMALHGRVVAMHSYWNADQSFILTDIRIRPVRFAKGGRGGEDVTVTLMGGTVGDLTTLVVGGPELVPGSDYVLFLNREDLPGAARALTVRDLAQGVFEVMGAGANRRAVSQANAHPLLPDAAGIAEPPGGTEGLPLEDLVREIETLAGQR